ncbi:hypothetical protein KKE14_03400 [Patescibacteria group bacterium]|nr:hypothetical protein [Patescibacteria group bacterium]
MDQKIINYYYKQIVLALGECEIKLQKNPTMHTSDGKRTGVSGWYQDGIITIKSTGHVNIALILIHEALHHIYPTWPEIDYMGEPIELFARSLLCEFSTRQIDHIMSFLP